MPYKIYVFKTSYKYHKHISWVKCTFKGLCFLLNLTHILKTKQIPITDGELIVLKLNQWLI